MSKTYKTILVQLDTFCGTGCTYCVLPSNKPDKAKYGFDNLAPLVKLTEASRIIMFGGDTYYDPKQIKALFMFCMENENITEVAAVSELWKLERDMKLIIELQEIAEQYDKSFLCEFSADLFGSKAVTSSKSLVHLFSKIPQNFISMNCVLTANQLSVLDCNKAVSNLIQVLTDDVLPNLTLNIKFDYDSCERYIDGLEEKAESFMRSLYRTQRVTPYIANTATSQGSSCRVRQGGITVDTKGSIGACSIAAPSRDIPTDVKVLDITREILDGVIKEIDEYAERIENDKCRSCEAKDVCSRCVKAINKAHTNFTEDVATCQFYKTFHRLSLECKEDEYIGQGRGKW